MREDYRNKNTEPKPIRTLFDKYKKTLCAPAGSVVKSFRSSVHDVLGIELKEEEVAYNPSTRTIFMQRPGPQKQEILFQKEKLLLLCRRDLGERSAPKDIV